MNADDESRLIDLLAERQDEIDCAKLATSTPVVILRGGFNLNFKS